MHASSRLHHSATLFRADEVAIDQNLGTKVRYVERSPIRAVCPMSLGGHPRGLKANAITRRERQARGGVTRAGWRRIDARKSSVTQCRVDDADVGPSWRNLGSASPCGAVPPAEHEEQPYRQSPQREPTTRQNRASTEPGAVQSATACSSTRTTARTDRPLPLTQRGPKFSPILAQSGRWAPRLRWPAQMDDDRHSEYQASG